MKFYSVIHQIIIILILFLLIQLQLIKSESIDSCIDTADIIDTPEYSNSQSICSSDMSVIKPISRAIKQVVQTSKQVEGGGFVVRRALGSQKLSYIDPFLMLDHLGPVTSKPGEAVGAPDHPHRGIETVTYILSGGMQHQDSQGNKGDIVSGGVQWMTAGSGVIHSEMPGDELQSSGGTLEGFQLWINLPRAHKMTKPRYQDIRPETFTQVPIYFTDQDGKESKEINTLVKVIAGEVKGIKSSIDTFTPIQLLDIHLLKPNSYFTQPVPAEHNGFLYVYRGSGLFGPKDIPAKEGQVLELDKGDEKSMKNGSDEECKVLLVSGKPFNEPISRYGPFVMNTQEEIRQAFIDYQSGKFGEIAGSEERYKKTKAALEKSGGPLAPKDKN